ncbi:MAG: PilN domain-containing protein [Gaiellaceae bacterium]|jgi:Tfp pilus assembly protein PilN
MRAVNLLPREVTNTKSRRPSAPLITAFVAGVVVLTVLAAGYFKQSASVSQKRTELQAARAELALVPSPAAPDTAVTALKGEQGQRVTALQSALNSRVAWDRVLREVSLVMPSDVWLSSLTLAAPDSLTVLPGSATTGTTTTTATTLPTAPVAPTDFVMNGKSFSHVSVARLMSRLALVPDLERVTLNHSTRSTSGSRPTVEFSVVAAVRAPGGTP